MASLLTRTAHNSRSRPSEVARIWSVRRPLSLNVLQYRHNCHASVPSPEAYSATDRVADTRVSRESPPAVLKTKTFLSDRPINDTTAYPGDKREQFRISQTPRDTFTIFEPRLTQTAVNHDVSPVRYSPHASRIVAQESYHNSPRQGSVSGKEQSIGSAFGFINTSLSSASTTSEAIAILKHRHQQGLYIDPYMFVHILKRCSEQRAFTAARQVHDYIQQSGLQKHPFVATTLLNVYIKCGRLQDAQPVFDGLEKNNRNLITWNVMIGAYAKSGCGLEAYRLFLQMNREGFIPDAITYLSILNASASAGALHWVKDVHGHARKAGLESDLRVGNALVHMYAKSGSIDDARLVFDTMQKRNVITWSGMIGAYAESGCGPQAYRLFLQMKEEGFIPNAITYVSILNASASTEASDWVKEVHADVCRAGLESDLRVGNALVHMYSKIDDIDNARLAFDRMQKRDVITWNIMIQAYAERGCGVEAYRLYLQMKQAGFVPDAITFVNILNSSANARTLDWVKEVHGHTCEAGLESDLRVSNALVFMYAESGGIDDARDTFDRMKKRDVVTWNIIIGAYAGSGCGVEAYELFLQMKREGFVPDAITFVNILNASASAGALEWVKELHLYVQEVGLESDLRVGNALVHMYAKSGSINDARLIFDKMKIRDVVTFATMIGGLAQHGCGHEALELFKKMNADCLKPHGTLFVTLLSACCHAGLVDDGRRLFLAMTEDHGIYPTVVHYNCMVDLLGRAGHLEEAKLLIDNMPVEPNEVTWKALLSACRSYGNVELGEFAAKEVLKLDAGDSAAYVLLSNIYAAAGKWEKVARVRSMMEDRGVRKERGRSWIEVDNKIHEFFVGDTSHPETKAIYSELNSLTEKLKAEGYVPDTRLVLLNVDTEYKELALCSHSEKLAIVYGILRVPRGEPIRVFKNLRVCSDCHTATKLISKVTGREIIAKDANRFHHFKDGVCSCGDYW